MVVGSVGARTLVVEPLAGEKWWGGVTLFGSKQPYETIDHKDLANRNYCNPCAPLFVSNRGRYVWSDRPFGFKFDKGVLTIDYTDGEPKVVAAGKTLKEAYLAASREHFPPTGTIPEELFFTRPQFNTWIESNLVDNDQRMIEDYIDSIMSNRFPAGVLMVDDGWAPTNRYGDLVFNRARFPNPKAMFARARKAGMRTMLWITPYAFDTAEFRKEGERRQMFIRYPDGKVYDGTYWPTLPPSGVMNLLDTRVWALAEARYRKFMNDYGFDGYKFDFTDAECLLYRDKRTNSAAPLPDGKVPVDYTEAWGRFASSFRFHELRAGWKAGGLPLVYRLQDKRHSWPDLRKLIPDMLAAGLLGCAYTCPDMIGGGDGGQFQRIRDGKEKLDVRLFVRSAQVQALMPMMQFSAAPWRVLKGADLDACRAAADLHVEFAPLIVRLARESSVSGEPIVRTMEYEYPNQGFDACLQQFMLGSEWLVAPVVSADDSVEVRLPAGKWTDDLGVTHVGPKVLMLKNVPLSRLPRFRKVTAAMTFEPLEGGAVRMKSEIGVFDTVTSSVPVRVVSSEPSRLEVELTTADGKVSAVWGDGKVVLSAPAGRKMTTPLAYPPAWRTQSGDKAIHPMSEGRIVDVEKDAPLFYPSKKGYSFRRAHELSMGFFGIERKGTYLMNGVGEPLFAEYFISFTKPRVAEIRWMPDDGKWGKDRELVFFPAARIGKAAGDYRAWRESQNHVSTIVERMKDNPNLKRLPGAAVFWVWDDNAQNRLYNWPLVKESAPRDVKRIADEMKSLGMDRVIWCGFDNERKEDAAYLTSIGYLVGTYDCFRDVYHKELLKYTDPKNFVRGARFLPFAEDVACIDKDGKIETAWTIPDKNGKLHDMYGLCDMCGPRLAKELIAPDVKAIGFTARLMDVQIAEGPHACFSPKHPGTLRQALDAQREEHRYLQSELKQVVGTERGSENHIGCFDYAEGMLSTPMQCSQPMGWRTKDSAFFGKDVPQNWRREGLDPVSRFPLWELVYHDASVSYFHWMDTTMRYPEQAKWRDALCALYGVPPIYSMRVEFWDKLKKEVAASYARVSPIARQTIGSRMIDFEYVTCDRMVQRSTFANGMIVTVDFNTLEVRVTKKRPLVVENDNLKVEFESESGAIDVVEKRTGRYFRQLRGETKPLAISNARLVETNRIEFEFTAAGADGKYSAAIALEGSELLVTLDGEASAKVDAIEYPLPFRLEKGRGQRVLFPICAGAAYDVDEPKWKPARTLPLWVRNGVKMGMWSEYEEKLNEDGSIAQGAGFMALVETQPFGEIDFRVRSNGLPAAFMRWRGALGKFKCARRFRYCFFSEASPMNMARRYRRYAKEAGHLVTFKEKKAKNPKRAAAIDLLEGAPNVWYWALKGDKAGMARKLKAIGFDNFLYSYITRPDLGADVTAAEIAEVAKVPRVLQSEYDIYTDLVDPKNLEKIDFVRPHWPEEAWDLDEIVRERDGSVRYGWTVPLKNDPLKKPVIGCALVCESKALKYLYERVAKRQAECPELAARFIDVTGTIVQECWNAKHPIDKYESAQARRKILGALGERFDLVSGTESGLECVVPDCDYFEGNFSSSACGSGRDMARIEEEPEYVAVANDPRTRVPFWEMVYHDCVVSYWYWCDYNNKYPKVWWRRDLLNAVTGTPPMYIVTEENFESFRERLAESVKVTVPAAKATAESPMANYRWLTSDRLVQQSVFENGFTVTVNFGDTPYLMSDGYVLRPRSHRFK